MAEKTWISPPPKRCDTCGTHIETKFYDAKTIHGPWAIMCPSCHSFGPGLGKVGTGLGQEYTRLRKADGSEPWVKTAG